MKKYLIATILCIIMVITCAACGNNPESTNELKVVETTTSTTTETTTTETIPETTTTETTTTAAFTGETCDYTFHDPIYYEDESSIQAAEESRNAIAREKFGENYYMNDNYAYYYSDESTSYIVDVYGNEVTDEIYDEGDYTDEYQNNYNSDMVLIDSGEQINIYNNTTYNNMTFDERHIPLNDNEVAIPDMYNVPIGTKVYITGEGFSGYFTVGGYRTGCIYEINSNDAYYQYQTPYKTTDSVCFVWMDVYVCQ